MAKGRRTPVFYRMQGMVKNMSPAYFAMVMATGIVSISSHLFGMMMIAKALFVLNIFAYVVLVTATVWRFLKYRAEFLKDLFSHTNGVGSLRWSPPRACWVPSPYC